MFVPQASLAVPSFCSAGCYSGSALGLTRHPHLDQAFKPRSRATAITLRLGLLAAAAFVGSVRKSRRGHGRLAQVGRWAGRKKGKSQRAPRRKASEPASKAHSETSYDADWDDDDVAAEAWLQSARSLQEDAVRSGSWRPPEPPQSPPPKAAGRARNKIVDNAAYWEVEEDDEEEDAPFVDSSASWQPRVKQLWQPPKAYEAELARQKRASAGYDPAEEVASEGGQRPRVRYDWQVPQAAGPEVVFVGRSNAGKSTLLNALLQHHGSDSRARTASMEGRTRSLDWYPVKFPSAIQWDDKGFLSRSEKEKTAEVRREGVCLVDCFGLGKVKYKLKAKRVQSWSPLLLKYLGKRKALTAVLHLVSAEFNGELEEGDEELFEIFRRAVSERQGKGLKPFRYIMVLTKSDLSKANKVKDMVVQLRRRLQEDYGSIFSTSPEVEIMTVGALAEANMTSFIGIDDLATAIDAAAGHGWDLLDEWREEMTADSGKDKKRSRQSQKFVRSVFAEGRRQTYNRPGRRGSKDKMTGQLLPDSV